ncbi:MAG: hypothetical protein BGN85_08725 [Alphaproteobacteria bacterium 64-11]|nr:MAG: hypothetical protein BGN85_08725 [Alphaproteobacteria bacterium 64-11]
MTGADRLERIRSRLDAIGPASWVIVADGPATALEVLDAAGRPVARLCAFERATPDEIELVANAPEDLRFLLALLADGEQKPGERASAKLKAGTEAPKDYAAEAAMACARPAWGRFLADRAKADLPADAEATAALLRTALGIRSRKHLNTDGEAAARWKALKAEFMAWLNGYGGGN